MLDILKNFDSAEKGNAPSVARESTNEMKTILESFNSIQECGMEGMEMSEPTQEGHPVTVSVTASGKENVSDLIALMQQAAGIEQHVDMPMAHDAHIDKDSHNDTGEPDMAAMKRAILGPMEEDEDEDEDFANSPEDSEGSPEYIDHNFMTKDLSGGINRQKPKGSERVKDPAVESIKEQLMKALEGKYANDAQRKAVHAAKSKKKNESDVDEAHGNSKKYDDCWDGYERVPGTTRGEPGSCRKK